MMYFLSHMKGVAFIAMEDHMFVPFTLDLCRIMCVGSILLPEALIL